MEKELVCANCGSTNIEAWTNGFEMVNYAACKECGTMHMLKYMKEEEMTDYKACIESLKPKYDRCPTCGCNTRILSDEEGTSCYEDVNIEALRQVLHEKSQMIEALLEAMEPIVENIVVDEFDGEATYILVMPLKQDDLRHLKEVAEKVREGK